MTLKLMLPGVLALCRTLRAPAVMFAVTRSGLPSPSMSPASTARTPAPAITTFFSSKLKLPGPVLVLRRMETVLVWKLATARSILWSPSKSPAVTQNGACATVTPGARSTTGWAEKVGVAPAAAVVF